MNRHVAQTTRPPRTSHLRLEPLEDRRLLTAAAWGGYALDAQHSGQSTVAGQPLEAIHWETPVDSAPQYSGGDLFIHYGSPVVTAANTVIVPEKNETAGGFDVKGIDGTTGALKWTQTEGQEYVPPPHDWTPSYGVTLAALAGGPRLYFPGADGTVFFRDVPDSNGAVTAGRIAFYGDANYNANPSAYAGIKISSPLTADGDGNIYFTYRVDAANPLGLTGGIARIGADGSLSHVDAGTPAMDSAPALNADGTKLYAVINGNLVEFDAATLTEMAQAPLGLVHQDSSASPTVGPDGDVYFGVLSPSVHFRGSLEHFSADLSQSYTPGSFGWDDTVTIVPASMVPSYTGTSSYLLMTKYNDYAGAGGTGINKIAIVDPNTTQIDAVTGQPAMATVLSIAGITPDGDFPSKPGAVREWCINSAVVDPATHSIFANNEDGWLYRWDTTTNSFTQRIQLTSGVGEAYTPTIIGADGTVFAINNAILFAVGQQPSTVTNRFLFYAGSGYDKTGSALPYTPLAYSDDNAIATDKGAYLPGSGAATFANVSSFSQGINGIMVDLSPGGDHPSINTSDFVFKSGNTATVDGTWTMLSGASLPAISVRLGMTGSANGAGTVSGSDRVELIWAPGAAVTQKWLEVTVKAGADTGLTADDHFFFGSEIGDANKSNLPTIFKVTASDTSATQTHLAPLGTNQPITNVFDFNRDGAVGAGDITLDQTHGTTNSTGLVVINIAAAGPFAPMPSAAIENVNVEPRVSALGLPSLASALSSVASDRRIDPPSLPKWIANRLSHVESNHGSVARYFEHLAQETRSPLTKIEHAENPFSDHLSRRLLLGRLS